MAREADGEIRDVDHLLHFAFTLGQDFACFERDQGAKIVFETAQLIADLAHDLSALGGRQHAPAVEHFDASLDGALVVFGSGEAHSGELASIGGIQ